MKKGLVIILDGFGEGVADPKINAIAAAKMPFYHKIRAENPLSFLHAKGNAVGLPDGAMGGSEVGHLTIGAGRIVWQPLEQIRRSFAEGEFEQKPDFQKWLTKVQTEKCAVHLLGMLSDGGIHSHIQHLFELLKVLKKAGVTENVYIHVIADGRDVPPKSIQKYLAELEQQIQEIGVGKIASLVGRYYAMDRDKNWSRTQVAYELLTQRKGEKIELDENFPEKIYAAAENDYYLKPYVLSDFPAVDATSAFIFWNFRSDRSEQLTHLFTDPKPLTAIAQDLVQSQEQVSSELERSFLIPADQFLAFGPYTLGNAVDLFTPTRIVNGMGEWLAKKHLKQLRLAETEKFAHVTFFFNGQEKEPWSGEDRILIPSPKCPSYAAAPEMSAGGITDALIAAVKEEKYDFIFCNYANPDLVGHSGDFDAVVESLEFLDTCLARAIPSAHEHGYEILLTADHGNADDMKYPDGSPKPSHSLNVVPCTIISSRENVHLKAEGGMKDISPTILDLMEVEKPPEMTGESLVI